MENIWSFLYQTLSASLTALILLFLKRLFRDKLSPRWQYGIWGVLALRLLLPASPRRSLLIPLALVLEILKTWVEGGLSSVYSGVTVPVRISAPFPLLAGLPGSVTDYLFLIYTLGVALFLLRYLWVYGKLRKIVKQGKPPSEETGEKIRETAEKYGLKACPAVTLPGISSAFICGIIRPVLVLPEGIPDEKILLHELLHLNRFDTLQNVFWCLLHSLHWCNPFLSYVFRQVEDDMEMLCDERVLQRLSGEDRREYGQILLSMANEPYARFPGTSSISNGGQAIARRIEMIVHFRKFPRGMRLVSCCIILVTGAFCLSGNRTVYAERFYHPETSFQKMVSDALSRVNRCATPAAALDIYAKGLVFENDCYLAMSRPLEGETEDLPALRETLEANQASSYGKIDQARIMNCHYTGKDHLAADLNILVIGDFRERAAFGEEGGEDFLPFCSVIVPVEASFEDGWVIRETGERRVSYFRNREELPALKSEISSASCGEVRLNVSTAFLVGGKAEEGKAEEGYSWIPFDFSQWEQPMSDSVDPEVDFTGAQQRTELVYHCERSEEGKLPETWISLGGHLIGYGTEETERVTARGDMSSTYTDSQGNFDASIKNAGEWDGVLTAEGYHSAEPEKLLTEGSYPVRVRVYWNGDDLVFEKEMG